MADPTAETDARATLARALAELGLERAAFGQDLGETRGRFARTWRRMVRRLLRWYAAPQVAWNDLACRAMVELSHRADRLAADCAALDARLAALGAPEAALDPGRLSSLDPPAPGRFPAAVRALSAGRPLVVIGAGIGERLRELAEPASDVRGIEEVAAWADRARADGWSIDGEAAAVALARLAAGSVRTVVIDRRVEETSLDGLLALLRAVAGVLAPGGVLIATAANPAAPDALQLAADAPCHRRFVGPTLLGALGHAAGLVEVGAYGLGADERALDRPYTVTTPAYGFVWRR